MIWVPTANRYSLRAIASPVIPRNSAQFHVIRALFLKIPHNSSTISNNCTQFEHNFEQFRTSLHNYSTISNNSAQFHAIWVQFRTIPHNSAQFRTISNNSAQFHAIRVQFRTIPHNSAQFYAIRALFRTILRKGIPIGNPINWIMLEIEKVFISSMFFVFKIRYKILQLVDLVLSILLTSCIFFLLNFYSKHFYKLALSQFRLRYKIMI